MKKDPRPRLIIARINIELNFVDANELEQYRHNYQTNPFTDTVPYAVNIHPTDTGIGRPRRVSCKGRKAKASRLSASTRVELSIVIVDLTPPPRKKTLPRVFISFLRRI